MATIINNPGNGEETDSGLSMVMGVVLLLVIVGLFFIYVLPIIRNNQAVPQNSTIDVNVKLPAGNTTPAPTAPTP